MHLSGRFHKRIPLFLNFAKKVLFFKKNISKLTDAELLQQHKTSGKTDYFGELYSRYIPLLYGLCLKYLRDESLAQDTVIQLFEDLH